MRISNSSRITGMAARIRRMPALATGLLVAVIAGLGMTLAHHGPRPAPRPEAAIRAALRDPHVRRKLSLVHWDAATASPENGQLERVVFFAHGRVVDDVALERDGRVARGVNFERATIPYGDWIAYQPALLVGLGALFVLMAGVVPWRRIRNMDAAAALSLLAPVFLLQDRHLGASAAAAVPSLTYLLVRCAWIGLRPARSSGTARRSPEPVRLASPATPLFVALTPNQDAAQRKRIMRMALVALALIYVMVGVSSPYAVDVIYAVMEGATKILHGVLPYGHMPGDVLHGDTYPLLSYALYAPLAWLSPVRSGWDRVDAALAAAVVAALITAWALFRATAAARRSRRAVRSPLAEEAGLRAALTWLAFPPLLITVSTGSTDVMLAAMLAGALLVWRRPAVSSGLLCAAGWFKLAPFALLPLWIAPLRGRGRRAALVAIAAVSAPLLGLLMALGGLHALGAMLHAVSFQFSRRSDQSVWAALGAEGFRAPAECCVLGLLGAAAVELHREPGLWQDRARIAALAAAILIGLQLAADYWTFLYLGWILPPVVLSLLADAQPANVAAVLRPRTARASNLLPAPGG